MTVLGCGYVLVSLVMGHGDFGGHGDGGGDAGGEAHMDYGVDGGGHGSASAGHGGGEFHFPFFSPLALATLLGSVGAYGLIALYGFKLQPALSLAAATPFAFATTYLISYMTWRLVSSSVGSSEIRLSDLRGAQAEVITPIPEAGLGEIAAMVRGQRYTGPAREEKGQAVPRGVQVTVKELMGTTLIITVGEK